MIKLGQQVICDNCIGLILAIIDKENTWRTNIVVIGWIDPPIYKYYNTLQEKYPNIKSMYSHHFKHKHTLLTNNKKYKHIALFYDDDARIKEIK